MRVTNNMMLRNTTSNINNNKYSVNSLNNQMSSQKKNLKTFRGSGCCHPRTSSEKQFK